MASLQHRHFCFDVAHSASRPVNDRLLGFAIPISDIQIKRWPCGGHAISRTETTILNQTHCDNLTWLLDNCCGLFHATVQSACGSELERRREFLDVVGRPSKTCCRLLPDKSFAPKEACFSHSEESGHSFPEILVPNELVCGFVRGDVLRGRPLRERAANQGHEKPLDQTLRHLRCLTFSLCSPQCCLTLRAAD